MDYSRKGPMKIRTTLGRYKTMMKNIKTSLLTIAFGCFVCVTGANADGSDCDLITLSGIGNVSPDLTITGNETLTVADSGKETLVKFTADPLGIVEIDSTTGVSTSIYSHEFKSEGKGKLAFTTIDKITIVPLGTDPQCIKAPCGLVFQLKLTEGHGKYNCGEIVSGYDPNPAASIPFTSYSVDGVVHLNSRGKLCKCSGNN